MAAAIMAGLATPAANAASYTAGDTWVLDGATDWVSRNPFAGLGTIADLGGPDTNTVWAMRQYEDVYNDASSFLTSPVLLNTYSNATPPYRCHLTDQTRYQARISDTNMAHGPGTAGGGTSDGPRKLSALVWESPVAGTVQMEADLYYEAAGMISFGVFLETGGAFYQVQKGVIDQTVLRQTNKTVNATVSVNAGDRLLFIQRGYNPNSGGEWVYTTGGGSYDLRWANQRNLRVTYLSAANDQRPAAQPASWNRADVYWRADLLRNPYVAIEAAARDRRDPTAPPRYYHYMSTNSLMTNTVAGLSAGEKLVKPSVRTGGYGYLDVQIADENLYVGLNQTQLPVWIFRPPKPGIYRIFGTVRTYSRPTYGVPPNVEFWIGSVALDSWSTNSPVVNSVSLGTHVKMGGSGATNTIDQAWHLPTANDGIYMTTMGYGGAGTIWSVLEDKNLTIEPVPSGTVITLR